MKTIILGKESNISNHLSKKFKLEVYSIKEFIKNYKNFKNKNLNLIINSFYPSSKLNSIDSYYSFCEKSLLELSKLLDVINYKKVNKIIYTSSSSVYNLKSNNIKYFNRNFYASFKLSSEEMLKKFCVEKKIDIILARLFNVYGGNLDNFSIISKIKKKLLFKKEVLNIYNNGESIRDYIHLDDLTKFYKIFINKKLNGIFDVGSGYGVKLKDILISLNLKKTANFSKFNINELDYSVSNIDYIKNYFILKSRRKLEQYFNKTKLNKLPLYNYPSEQLKINDGFIIYGCGYSGLKLAKDFIKNKKKINFFVDDSVKKIGKSKHGIPIISYNQLKELSRYNKFKEVIIAIPSLSEMENIELVNKLRSISIKVSSLPRKYYYSSNYIQLEDIKEIPDEYVLERKSKIIKKNSLNKYNNKSFLITGGAGSIGSEIVKNLVEIKTKKIIVYDNSEFNIFRLKEQIGEKNVKFILGDIQNEKFLRSVILKHKISHILHAAAYKHVNFLETNVIPALENNFYGTVSVLNAIKLTNINAIFISTDKAVKPKNILGMTKRLAEIYLLKKIQNNNLYKKNKINIVRFGNVIGSAGSALPKFINQIKNNKAVTLTDLRMKRYFMNTKEATKLVLETCNLKNKNSIFILKMGNQIKIINIIKKLFKIFSQPGQKLNLKIIGSKKNEKITEELSISKKFIKTKNPNILYVNDPLPNNIQFDNFIKKLNLYMKKIDNKKCEKLLRNFFKKNI